MEQITSCGILVTRREPVFAVLVLRNYRNHDLPKGQLQPGETELACALRELREETGIEAGDLRLDPAFLGRVDYVVRVPRIGQVLKQLHVFWGELQREVRIRLSEHTGYRWLDWRPDLQLGSRILDPIFAQFADHLQRRDLP